MGNAGKAAGACRRPTTSPRADIKERVELYFLSRLS